MKLHSHLKLLAAFMALAGSFNLALAAEVQGGATTMAQPMSSKLGMVTQDRLNNAHKTRTTGSTSTADTNKPAITRAARLTPATFPSFGRHSCSRWH
jgi:hypothetical protein